MKRKQQARKTKKEGTNHQCYCFSFVTRSNLELKREAGADLSDDESFKSGSNDRSTHQGSDFEDFDEPRELPTSLTGAKKRKVRLSSIILFNKFLQIVENPSTDRSDLAESAAHAKSPRKPTIVDDGGKSKSMIDFLKEKKFRNFVGH